MRSDPRCPRSADGIWTARHWGADDVEFKSNHMRLMCIQCHHCKGLGAIHRAHPMTIDQNRLVSFKIQNKLRFMNADRNTYEDDKWYNCATGFTHFLKWLTETLLYACLGLVIGLMTQPFGNIVHRK